MDDVCACGRSAYEAVGNTFADHEPECEVFRQQLDWYNEGIVLLMNVMKGRAIDRDSAEFKVYEQWRKRGHLKEV